MSKYLISVDLSPLAQEVIHAGCSLATKMGADVVLIHSVPNLATWRGYEPALPMNMEEEMEGAARKKLENFLQLVESREEGITACVKEIAVFTGDPAGTVTDYAAEQNVNLIIVGHRGQTAWERILVGSTASNIAKYATTSVLIYRPDKPLL